MMEMTSLESRPGEQTFKFGAHGMFTASLAGRTLSVTVNVRFEVVTPWQPDLQRAKELARRASEHEARGEGLEALALYDLAIQAGGNHSFEYNLVKASLTRNEQERLCALMKIASADKARPTQPPATTSAPPSPGEQHLCHTFLSLCSRYWSGPCYFSHTSRSDLKDIELQLGIDELPNAQGEAFAVHLNLEPGRASVSRLGDTTTLRAEKRYSYDTTPRCVDLYLGDKNDLENSEKGFGESQSAFEHKYRWIWKHLLGTTIEFAPCSAAIPEKYRKPLATAKERLAHSVEEDQHSLDDMGLRITLRPFATAQPQAALPLATVEGEMTCPLGKTSAVAQPRANAEARERNLALERARAVADALGVKGVEIEIDPAGVGTDEVRLEFSPYCRECGKRTVHLHQYAAVHEFGHMLGLDEEYKSSYGFDPDADDKEAYVVDLGVALPNAAMPKHHNLVEAVFRDVDELDEGASYCARQLAPPGDRSGIMGVGNAVHLHHYVTILAALCRLTGTEMKDWRCARTPGGDPAIRW